MTRMRGFIGPIGDDIPSIFPIIAGVMLFLATIFYANAEAANRDSNLNLRKAALEISYAVLEKGYIGSADFAQHCDTLVKPVAAKDSVNFAVLLKGCSSLNTANPYGGDVICSSFDSPDFGEISKGRLALFDYPVAADCSIAGEVRAGLGRVTVITWYK